VTRRETSFMRALQLTAVLATTCGAGGCFQDMINQGAANVAVMAAGQVAGLAAQDGGCGFASLSTMLFSVSGLAPTDEGLAASWSVEQCKVGLDKPVKQKNCIGDETKLKGMATVSGSQELALRAALPPVPVDAHAVQIEVTEAEVFELELVVRSVNHEDQNATLTIHHGHVSGIVEPVLGESKSNPGVFMVPTPVARISNVQLKDASITIEAQGNTLDLEVDDSDLTATSGPFPGDETNHIGGTIVIDGETHDIDGEMQPDFDIDEFNESYACEEDLAGPVK
jgi:hypothetical protein